MVKNILLAMLLVAVFAAPVPASPANAAVVNGIPGGFDMNTVDAGLAQAKKLEGKIKIPKNAYKEKADEAAQKTFDFFKSNEYQQRLAAETERLKQTVFKGIKSYYKDLPGSGKSTGKTKLPSNARIYMFISSSVPPSTLRTYIEQIAGLHDPNVKVLMRGFIGGMKYIHPTMKFIGSLLEKDPACGLKCGICRLNVEVDPFVFRRYGVLRVPAVVYVPDIRIERPGSEGLEKNAAVSQWYAFYGDVALPYALKRINEEAKSSSLAAVIKEFDHGFYK